jgi:hypothetical protein
VAEFEEELVALVGRSRAYHGEGSAGADRDVARRAVSAAATALWERVDASGRAGGECFRACPPSRRGGRRPDEPPAAEPPVAEPPVAEPPVAEPAGTEERVDGEDLVAVLRELVVAVRGLTRAYQGRGGEGRE